MSAEKPDNFNKPPVSKPTHKERPSDATGAIRKQPGMSHIPTSQGSRDMAHRLDQPKKGSEKFELPKLPPLIIDGRHITTGKDAFIVRDMKRVTRKSIRDEMAQYGGEPNNPHRLRLKKQLEALEKNIQRATNFLDQWTDLDHSRYLRGLVNTHDPLADNARELLGLRDRNKQHNLTESEQHLKQALSDSIRDALMARIRQKGIQKK